MKKDIHPPYQEVLFVDTTAGVKFVCGSTYQSKQKEMFEGKEYPVCYITVSSASHPFFTGSKQFVDSEGRVDKFIKRYKQKEEQSRDEHQKKEPEAQVKKARPRKKST